MPPFKYIRFGLLAAFLPLSFLLFVVGCSGPQTIRRRVTVNALVFTDHAEHFNRLLQAVNPQANLQLIQVREVGPEAILLKGWRLANGWCWWAIAPR